MGRGGTAKANQAYSRESAAGRREGEVRLVNLSHPGQVGSTAMLVGRFLTKPGPLHSVVHGAMWAHPV